MGMIKRTLHAATKEVDRFSGGVSTLLYPRRLKDPVAAGVVAGAGALIIGREGFKEHNALKLGRVTYAPGPARMTSAYGSGAVQTMMQASEGNYGLFSDMAEEVVSAQDNVVAGILDDYGANAKFISALYNMGG